MIWQFLTIYTEPIKLNYNQRQNDPNEQNDKKIMFVRENHLSRSFLLR
jgi:hypothetical protein